MKRVKRVLPLLLTIGAVLVCGYAGWRMVGGGESTRAPEAAIPDVLDRDCPTRENEIEGTLEPDPDPAVAEEVRPAPAPTVIRVVQQADGAAIPGALVLGGLREDGTVVLDVRTGSHGVVEVDAEQARRFVRFLARADGFLEGSAANRGGLIEIRLEKAVGIRVRVIDQSGGPVENAVVYAGSRSAATDADGCCELQGWRHLDTVLVMASDGMTSARRLVKLEAVGDRGQQVELQLVRDGFARVEVTDADTGMPVSGAKVTLTRDEGWPPRSSSATTGQDGAVRLAGVTPGYYELRVAAPGYEPISAFPETVAPGQYDSKVRITRSGKRLVAGSVVDETGAAIPNAEVRLSSPHNPERSVRTDERGRFQISGLSLDAPGYRELGPWKWAPTANLRITATGRAASTFTKVPYDSDREYVLPRTLSVIGRILDSDGRPVTDYTLSYLSDEGAFALEPPDPRTLQPRIREDGRFTWKGLPRSAGTLSVLASGRKATVLFDPGGDERFDFGDIRISQPDSDLEITVLDGSGEHLEPVLVWASPLTSSGVPARTRARCGRAVIVLSAGDYIVGAYNREFVIEESAVQVGPGTTARVTLQAFRTSEIRIDAIRSDSAVDGLRVKLLYEGPHQKAFRSRHALNEWSSGRSHGSLQSLEEEKATDALGLCSFGSLPPGRYSVSYSSDDGTEMSVAVVLQEGESRLVALQVEK